MNTNPMNQTENQPTFLPSHVQINASQPQDVSTLVVPQNIQQKRAINLQAQQLQPDNLDPKRHRRSKHEQEGRVYHCDCGKSYLSQPALNNHKKSKHPELNTNGEKRGRGRPRKYLPNSAGEFETNKYENFFSNQNRKKEDGKSLDIQSIIESVYQFLFCGEYKDKLYSNPTSLDDNILLHNFKITAPISTREKKEKVCDDVLYEYLVLAKEQTNEIYFTLILKFILLFRECFNQSKNQNSAEQEERHEASQTTVPESLPELCNDFYTNFMENNNFFGIEDEQDKSEIIEIIQHFCIWLFKNDYTKSKLSLAQ